MKTLIYDNDCPLCAGYTSLFVSAGILQKEGRQHFNEASPAITNSIDRCRMHDEIPLVESETGKTWYGVDALLELLDTKIPFIKTIGTLGPVNWLLKKMYRLISLNRKVIVAVRAKGYDCSPTFSSRYRILFLLLGLAFNSWVFSLAIPLIIATVFPQSNYAELQMIHFALVAINTTAAFALGKSKGLEYLGQVNMLALISMLLVLPLLCVQRIVPAAFVCAGFGVIGCIVAKEYFRRMRYAHILDCNKQIAVLNAACGAITFIYLLK